MDILEKYKIVRRLLMLWVMILITFAVWTVFSNLTAVTTAVAAVYSATVGVLATVIGFYTHERFKEDKKE